MPLRRPYASSSACRRGAISRSSVCSRAVPSTCVIAREPRAPLRPHREDARHEARQPRAARRQLEIAVGRLDRHDRRERPELLAILDVAIEPVAHLARVRRGEDAAMAERARAELGGAIHPADDAAGGELVRDPFDERCHRRALSTSWPSSRRGPRQLVSVDRRAPRTDGRARRGRDCRNGCDRHRARPRARSPHRRAPAERTRARSRTRRGCARWRRR